MSGAGKTKLEELESFFKEFPDVPKEIIIKQDLLRLGQWFTEAALNEASGSLVKSYRLFSYDLVPMEHLGRKEHQKIPEWFTIRDGIYGLRPVAVQTTLSVSSPYVIDVVEGSSKLCVNKTPVCDVSFPRNMKYCDLKFEDGTSYREMVAYGRFITVFRYCQYWGANEECRFCDINANARQMKQSKSFTFTAAVKPVSRVASACSAIEREVVAEVGFPIPLDFTITGGTIIRKLNGKTEDDFYLEYAEAVKWGGPRRFVNLQTNAKDKSILRRYRASGVDSHHANMEVWDRRLFEWINPGKTSRIGYDKWVQSLLDSVNVFGEGNVRPNFVAGVEMARPHGFATASEAVKSTTAGINFLMQHGVFPRFNQWRREPNSDLVQQCDQPPVPTQRHGSWLRVMARTMTTFFLWRSHTTRKELTTLCEKV